MTPNKLDTCISRAVGCLVIIFCLVSPYSAYPASKFVLDMSVNYSSADVSPEDIKYTLFKHTKPEDGIHLTAETLNNTSLDTSLPTKVLLHGWMSAGVNSPWYSGSRDAYFQKGPHNIFYIDYTIPGNKSYLQSIANIVLVGKYVGEFLVDTGIPQQNIHLIGHSLGSHTAGFVAKTIYKMTGQKVARITSLDAGGPVFETSVPKDKRLNSDDADFVDAIHTDINHYAYVLPLGHVDFYPNYGSNQPGCPPLDVDANCSHARATLYFVESINTRNSTAQEAKISTEENNVTVEIIEGGKDVIFGDNVPVTARGVYYLKTNPEVPYLII